MRGICKAAQRSLRLAVLRLFGTQFSVFAGTTNAIGPMCGTLEKILSRIQQHIEVPIIYSSETFLRISLSVQVVNKFEYECLIRTCVSCFFLSVYPAHAEVYNVRSS